MNGWSILRGLLTGVDIDEARESGLYRDEEDVEASREIWKWCQREKIELLQLALQFCIREDRIHGNPIGSLNKIQLEANILAASRPVEEAVWKKFDLKFG